MTERFRQWRQRRASRPEFVRSSQTRIWRITFVAVLAIIALTASVEALIHAYAASSSQSRDNRARIADEEAIVAALRIQERCDRRTLAAYTGQAANLGPLGNARINDLFSALDAALAGDQRKARRIYQRASKENQRYLRYVAHHPVPTVRACRLPPLPSPRATTPTPRPSAATRTVSAPGPTRTVTDHPPPQTVTRTVTTPPGKARTVTATRTATVTVTHTANPLCTVVPGVTTC